MLAAAARSAFVDAMGTTAMVAAGFALVGALIALIFLPAREADAMTEDVVAPTMSPPEVTGT